MNYLITGGTGLIGRALIDKLLLNDATNNKKESSEKNIQITVLTRNITNAKKILSSQVKLISEISINDIEHADVVINLAGEAIADKRWSESQKSKICNSRWKITTHLVELINKAKNSPRLLISGSAIGIYGRQGTEFINEQFNNYHKEFTHTVCAKWEELALGASTNTRVALLRTGIVLADNGGVLAKMLLPFSLGLGGKISKGEQIMSWIHINDMVNAILHIESHEHLSGPINLTAPNPVSNKVFSEALAKQLKRPCFITTPAWLLLLLFGEMSDLLLFGQNVIPQKLIDSGFTFKYSDVNEALSNITQ